MFFLVSNTNAGVDTTHVVIFVTDVARCIIKNDGGLESLLLQMNVRDASVLDMLPNVTLILR